MTTPRVVIIGAGPAGGACALTLAKLRCAEVIVVDKSTYPRTKVCGSGLSPHALQMLDRLELRDRFAGGAVHMPRLLARGPDGDEVRLDGRGGAWVVPRVELDATVIGEAVRYGATFREGTKVTELVRDAGGDVRGVLTSTGPIEADLVVCANGSPSRFSTDGTPVNGIRTIMGWWSGAALRRDEGVMIWDRRLAGYYAWAFPEPHGVVNIGLTIPEHAPGTEHLKALFEQILAEHFGAALASAQPIGKWMGHPATVTTRVGEIAESHAMWIGEAARLVSPGTVEGISFAMESGMLAADAIAHGFDLEHGFTRAQRAMLRTKLVARMLPKFWAGEAFVRLMRSSRARELSSKLLSPQWFAQKAARIVGDEPARTGAI
jgi:flavin-dependent dehydrogenase